MIPVHQSKPSAPPSGNQPTTNKTAFGLPAVFLGLLLPLGLVGNAALGSYDCDSPRMKEFCDGMTDKGDNYSRAKQVVTEAYEEFGLNVCNSSSESIYIAIASFHSEKYGFTSKGWWKADQGECKKTLAEYVKKGTYYLLISNNTIKEPGWPKSGPVAPATEDIKYFCVDTTFKSFHYSENYNMYCHPRLFHAIHIPDGKPGYRITVLDR